MTEIEKLVSVVIATLLLAIPTTAAIEFRNQAQDAVSLAEGYQAKLDAAVLELGLRPSTETATSCAAAPTVEEADDAAG